MSTLLDAALAIAAAGWPVFPCNGEKRPVCAGGFKAASRDPNRIRTLFAISSAALIGVPTGDVSGILVIDVDRRSGGLAWLDERKSDLPSTRTHRTLNDGLHLLFQMPDAEIRNSAGRIAPGVDVRASGGYICAPPSPGYSVADPCDIAPAPAWLIELCTAPPPPAVAPRPARHNPITEGGTRYGLKSLDDECAIVRNAPGGTQEATLNAAALKMGSLVAGGHLDAATARNALIEAGLSMQPTGRPWTPQEVEKKVRRGMDAGARTPRAPEPPPVEPIHPAQPMLDKLFKGQSKPLPVAPGLMDLDGALKMFVDECVRTAIRPQPFLALGAAICAIGALAGRKYRTATDLRTNIYIAAIAESGGGKDHAAEIMRRSIDDAGLGFYLGGETIASGRAVLSSLEKNPAILFQVDEFGMFLSSVTGKKSAPHKAEIWAELMKLYSRAKGIYRGTEYANKKDNPRIDIYQPCVTFYGTTTPSTFWSALQNGAMTDGSLARFLVFITDNNRPDRNKAPGIYATPPALIDALQAIASGAGAAAPSGSGNLPQTVFAPMSATQSLEPYTVKMTVEAERHHDAKLSDEDEWARKVEGTPQAAIVNRLGENAAKLALISAISRDPRAPSITIKDIAWGWLLAEHCTRSLLQDADRYIADTPFAALVKKIHDLIRRHGPVTKRQLTKSHGVVIAEREFNDAIKAMVDGGMVSIILDDRTGPGRRTVRYAINYASDADDSDVPPQFNMGASDGS